jgi:photosystem II protein PsbQ
MRKYQSVIAILLAFVASVFINGCSAAQVSKPLTYSPEQVQQIQTYAADLTAMRDRLPELAEQIQAQEWVDVRAFIRGPLGEVRFKMANLAQTLFPKSRKEISQLAKAISTNLVGIDQAAQGKVYKEAIRNYAEVLRDMDALINSIPQG